MVTIMISKQGIQYIHTVSHHCFLGRLGNMKKENSSQVQTALKPKRKSWELPGRKQRRKETKNFKNLLCVQHSDTLFISFQVRYFVL